MIRRLSLSLFALTISLALVLPASTAEAVGTLGPFETVSTAIDSSSAAGWWSPIAESGSYVYFAYNTDILGAGNENAHNVWVSRRNADGTFLRGCLKDGLGDCRRFTDDVGHHDPSIAIDADGYIHVFSGMHNSSWIYYRSSSAQDPTTLTERSSTMPDQGSGITYPNITRASNGDLWLIVRVDQSLGRGGRLYRWDDAANTWSLAKSFAYEDGRAVYPDAVVTTPDGDVHITFEWSKAPSSSIRHEASYLKYRPSTGTLFTADGTAVSAPVTTSTPYLVYRPLAANESYTDISGGPGVQTAKLVMHPTGTGYIPIAAYRYRSSATGPFAVYRATWGGSSWSSALVYGGAYDTTAALGISDDGTTKRIYYVKRDTALTDNAFVSESVNAGPFTERALATGVDIHRLAITTRSDGTDLIYLSTPNGSNGGPRGELYYRTLTR